MHLAVKGFLDFQLVMPLQFFISPLCYKILNSAEATKTKTIEDPFSALFPLLVHTQTFLVLGEKT